MEEQGNFQRICINKQVYELLVQKKLLQNQNSEYQKTIQKVKKEVGKNELRIRKLERRALEKDPERYSSERKRYCILKAKS